jgi:copper resistance protein B
MGHCKLEPAPRPSTTCVPEHAAMGHCTLTPAQPFGDPHAGHNMQSVGAAPLPPATPPPAAAFSGPANAADAFYDKAQMSEARGDMVREHGGMKTHQFLIDQLEARIGKGRDGYAWDAEAWYGGDINKLWVTTEGEGQFSGDFEGAEVQALWSRAIDPWFDLQLGVRQDIAPGPDRTHLVVGVQGLAPYWFEVDGAVFLSSRGDVTARAEVEYDLRITQRLILQPNAEIELSFQDIPELLIGAGLTSAELGTRLRYEIFPPSGPAVVAPYVGVQYERAFGDTARLHRAAGEEVGGWRFLAGVRTWF